MNVYTVIGYERTTRMMRVEAENEEEALEKAKRGEFDDVDTEPGPAIMLTKWHVGHGRWSTAT